MQQLQRPPIQPDDLISLRDATVLIPRKGKRRVHVSTILRWGQSGRITLYQCNGWKVSETELRSKFKPVVVR
jgi:hypothetical protein